MNTSMHGKPIRKICLSPDVGDKSASPFIEAQKFTTLELSVTYHGDRDEIWVVQKNGDTELARINCKYVVSIEWETRP